MPRVGRSGGEGGGGRGGRGGPSRPSRRLNGGPSSSAARTNTSAADDTVLGLKTGLDAAAAARRRGKRPATKAKQDSADKVRGWFDFFPVFLYIFSLSLPLIVFLIPRVFPYLLLPPLPVSHFLRPACRNLFSSKHACDGAPNVALRALRVPPTLSIPLWLTALANTPTTPSSV